MRPISLCSCLFIAILALLCTTPANGHHNIGSANFDLGRRQKDAVKRRCVKHDSTDNNYTCYFNYPQVSAGSSDISYKENVEPLRREKRQLEDFDNEFAPSARQEEQEEPSFWDRVIRVAMKLFSRFVEWLNT